MISKENMKKFRRILLYSVLGGVFLMLYLTLLTIKDNTEEEIRKGRYIKKDLKDYEEEIEEHGRLQREKTAKEGILKEGYENDLTDEEITRVLVIKKKFFNGWENQLEARRL